MVSFPLPRSLWIRNDRLTFAVRYAFPPLVSRSGIKGVTNMAGILTTYADDPHHPQGPQYDPEPSRKLQHCGTACNVRVQLRSLTESSNSDLLLQIPRPCRLWPALRPIRPALGLHRNPDLRCCPNRYGWAGYNSDRPNCPKILCGDTWSDIRSVPGLVHRFL
jgi:hypothetical protein